MENFCTTASTIYNSNVLHPMFSAALHEQIYTKQQSRTLHLAPHHSNWIFLSKKASPALHIFLDHFGTKRVCRIKGYSVSIAASRLRTAQVPSPFYVINTCFRSNPSTHLMYSTLLRLPLQFSTSINQHVDEEPIKYCVALLWFQFKPLVSCFNKPEKLQIANSEVYKSDNSSSIRCDLSLVHACHPISARLTVTPLIDHLCFLFSLRNADTNCSVFKS